MDKQSLETRMRIDMELDDKRANSRIEMQRRNAEYDKKVAMAAKAISRDRDLEKDKLTKINIDKTQAKQNRLYMQQDLNQEVYKNQSTHKLKTELQIQMNQKRDAVQIQTRLDQAQL